MRKLRSSKIKRLAGHAAVGALTEIPSSSCVLGCLNPYYNLPHQRISHWALQNNYKEIPISFFILSPDRSMHAYSRTDPSSKTMSNSREGRTPKTVADITSILLKDYSLSACLVCDLNHRKEELLQTWLSFQKLAKPEKLRLFETGSCVVSYLTNVSGGIRWHLRFLSGKTLAALDA